LTLADISKFRRRQVSKLLFQFIYSRILASRKQQDNSGGTAAEQRKNSGRKATFSSGISDKNATVRPGLIAILGIDAILSAKAGRNI